MKWLLFSIVLVCIGVWLALNTESGLGIDNTLIDKIKGALWLFGGAAMGLFLANIFSDMVGKKKQQIEDKRGNAAGCLFDISWIVLLIPGALTLGMFLFTFAPCANRCGTLSLFERFEVVGKLWYGLILSFAQIINN